MGEVKSDPSVYFCAVGNGFTLSLSKKGTVCSKGINNFGQLGRGFPNGGPDTKIPHPVIGIPERGAALVVGGFWHSAVVTVDNKLLMWGSNFSGQCGTGVMGGNFLTATPPIGALAEKDVRVAFVACSSFETVAVTTDGGVIVFGSNGCGQLGTGNNTNELNPVRLTCTVLEDVDIIGCATGGRTTYLISFDGRVFAMGSNFHGQLGLGHTNDVNTPTEIDAAHFGAPVAAVACNSHFMIALTCEGKLFSCGKGIRTPRPVDVVIDTFIVRIVACENDFFALSKEGKVFIAARNEGIGTLSLIIPPFQKLVDELEDTTVRSIGGGSCAREAVFLTGEPPTEPGFDGPLVFAMQKPAAHEPSADAIAAAEALKPSCKKGVSVVTTIASTGPPLKKVTQGMKRKREDEDYSSSSEEDETNDKDAKPLC